MKRIFLVSASLVIASATFAQTGATSGSLYNFDNAGTPKEVRRLGTAPEFPFLRNKTTADQVYRAIKQHSGDDTRAMNKLNDLLMQVGYTNGVQDLQPSDITQAYVKPGTEGNMGSRGYVYSYTRLNGKPSEFKAWKIEPKNNNGSLYVFAKCGNAFFPRNERKTACLTVPVNVTGDMNQITLNSSGSTTVTENKVFVYYNRRHHHRHDHLYPIADLNVKYPSMPIMLSETKDVNVLPETYSVTLTAPESTVSVCPDSTLILTANINVEKTSSYTGNYPKSDHKFYTEVSKREYKMIARRVRRIHRKEEKIARRIGMPVEATVTRA